MRRFFASLDAALCAAGRWLIQPLGTRIAVVTLLSIHAGLLAYSATRHSPTHLEPAFLASGISHWHFGRFELYRVNPPLVRMVAALPAMAVGCQTDWSRFYDGPGSRAEFPLGEDFLKANGPRSIPLFFYARWACIPFNLIGAYFACRWANELYGNGAGLVTLTLYVFEPNLLAHGELITPDGACTSFGIAAGYGFWRWLKQPTWFTAGFAGFALGLAELAKMSWLILFGLWPILWFAWRWLESNQIQKANFQNEKLRTLPPPDLPSPLVSKPPSIQLAAILLTALYLLNLGYAFDGCFTRLKDFTFVSTALTGLRTPGEPGNRFQSSLLGKLPLPVPKQYILGLDSQNRDFEHFEQPSFLRGEWKNGGWWYYYVYGLLVKIPCGIWGLFTFLILTRLFRRKRTAPLRDELVLITPAIVLLAIVSAQTEFNIHLRYAYPSLGIFLIVLGDIRSFFLTRIFLATLSTSGLIVYSVASLFLAYPHHLAYFNEFAGGSLHGRNHLLGSSLDWGQGMLDVTQWLAANQHGCCVTFNTAQNVVPELLTQTTHRKELSHCAPQNHPCSVRVFGAEQFDLQTRKFPHMKVIHRFPCGVVVTE